MQRQPKTVELLWDEVVKMSIKARRSKKYFLMFCALLGRALVLFSRYGKAVCGLKWRRYDAIVRKIEKTNRNLQNVATDKIKVPFVRQHFGIVKDAVWILDRIVHEPVTRRDYGIVYRNVRYGVRWMYEKGCKLILAAVNEDFQTFFKGDELSDLSLLVGSERFREAE